MDNYAVLRQVGKGSFGTADLVVDKRDKPRQYILKRTRLARQPEEQREATVQEMFIQKAICHRNVVHYKESWLDKGFITCLVLEYCPHGELQFMLRDSRGKYFPETVVMEMFVQMVSCLEYLHRNNIVHRDIKAANVFIREDFSLALGDFGLSQAESSSNTLLSTMLGTPQHMAPEILSGKSPKYSDKSDIWALGVLFFEVTALHSPFTAFDMQGLTSKVKKAQVPPLPGFYSEDWKDIVRSCLEKDPRKRPSAAELLRKPLFRSVVQSVDAKYGPPFPRGGGTTTPVSIPVDEMQKIMGMLDKKKVKGAADTKGLASISAKAPKAASRPSISVGTKKDRDETSLESLAAKIAGVPHLSDSTSLSRSGTISSPKSPVKRTDMSKPSVASSDDGSLRRKVPSVPSGSGLGGGRNPALPKKPEGAKAKDKAKEAAHTSQATPAKQTKTETPFPAANPKPLPKKAPSKSSQRTSMAEDSPSPAKAAVSRKTKPAAAKPAVTISLSNKPAVDIRTTRKPAVPEPSFKPVRVIEARSPVRAAGGKKTKVASTQKVQNEKATHKQPPAASAVKDERSKAADKASSDGRAEEKHMASTKSLVSKSKATDSAFAAASDGKQPERRTGIMARVKQNPSTKAVPAKATMTNKLHPAKGPIKGAQGVKQPSGPQSHDKPPKSMATQEQSPGKSMQSPKAGTPPAAPQVEPSPGATAAIATAPKNRGATADSASSHYDSNGSQDGAAAKIAALGETAGMNSSPSSPPAAEASSSSSISAPAVPRAISMRPKVGGGAAKNTKYTPVITLKAAPKPKKQGAGMEDEEQHHQVADEDGEIQIAGHQPMSKWSPGFGSMLNEVISIAESRTPSSSLPAKQAKFVERYRSLLKNK